VQMGNFGLPSKSIRQQIVSAVDLIVQVERQRDGGRRVVQLTEVCGQEGDVVILNDIFIFEITGESSDGRLHGLYRISRTRPAFQDRLAYFGVDRQWAATLEAAER
jgi:pilus assembly protein CpaF